MKLDAAIGIAEDMAAWLAPYCQQIEIAGSIRRGKDEVKDIEIVAMPGYKYERDMFGITTKAESWLEFMRWECRGKVIKNGERYKQIALHEGINLDLFIVMPPAQWGVLFLLRTGPADFSHWMVTQRDKGGALPDDCYVGGGCVYRAGEAIRMEREEDMFELCGLGYMEPWARRARWEWKGATE